MPLIKPFGKKAHDFIKRTPEQDKKYTLLEGSVRSSKTWAIDCKLIYRLCTYKVHGKRVICGATKQTVYKNMLLDIFAVVGKKNYSYNRASGELWLFGIQWFIIGARDESSYKNILGMTIGIALCDEWTEFPRSFTMQLFLRLSPPGARLYATTNPGTPQHYLFTEVIHNENFAPDLEIIHFTLEDNPNIDETTKKQIIASQKGVYYQRYILGLWVVAEGAIYKDAWSDSLLYTDDLINPTSVLTPDGKYVPVSKRPVSIYGHGGYTNHVIAIDYGTHNPCVFLEYFDDGDVVWEDREYYWDSVKEMKQKTDGEYADDLERFIKDSRIIGQNSPKIVVDPSATSFKLELTKRGLWVVDANNEVLDGIHRVSEVLACQALRVHYQNENARRETGLYSWDKKSGEKGNEQPIKMNDHTQDARRYAIMELFPDWRMITVMELLQLAA
jgi:PBSX family phage terminase large subunit